MKKRGIALLTALTFVVGFVACGGGGGGGKYADAKKAMGDMFDHMEKLATDLDKAEDAKAVAAALNTFNDAMEKLKPKIQELEKKYPELQDEANLPEELAEYSKKMEEMGPKFATAMMKIMQFADDPDVKAANEKFEKVFSDIQ
jgi:predicted nuclease with TOPRIM domain